MPIRLMMLLCLVTILTGCFQRGAYNYQRACCQAYKEHCKVRCDDDCPPCPPCNNYFPCIDHVDKYSCEDKS